MHIGVNLPAKQNVPVPAALELGYDFVTSRITTSAYRRKIQALHATTDPNTSTGATPPSGVPAPIDEDLALDPAGKIGQTIALAAPWAEIDAKDPVVADLNIKVLLYEIEYAQFCGVSIVVVPGPRRRTHISRYARSLALILRKAPKITLYLHTTFTEEFTEAGAPPADYLSTWTVWSSVFTLCSHSPNLKVALEVTTHPLPAFVTERWACEPVCMLVLSGINAFVPNAKKYPVLPKHVQALVSRFFVGSASQEPLVLLKEVDCNDNMQLVYMQHFDSKIPKTPLQVYARGMENVLQLPLEPQGNNLDNSTYEVFERDATKYHRYQESITAAFAKLGLEHYTVVVAGAGRGALVDKVLISAQELGLSVLVYALEKNPGAVTILRSRQRGNWGDKVKICAQDVRTWVAPQPADLIVSEMLGSFGDNELAPEALSNIQTALNPHHGVMIPQAHTSWIAPVFNPMLHLKTKALGFDQPYVVYFTQGQLLSNPQAVWKFEYPNRPTANDRVSRLTFTIKHAGVVHGFSGYFDAMLFNDIELTTLPNTANAPLSWFPMWFPLDTPIPVGDNNEVELTIWRTGENNQVFYEWSAEVFCREQSKKWRTCGVGIHNSGGRTVKWM